MNQNNQQKAKINFKASLGFFCQAIWSVYNQVVDINRLYRDIQNIHSDNMPEMSEKVNTIF